MTSKKVHFPHSKCQLLPYFPNGRLSLFHRIVPFKWKRFRSGTPGSSASKAQTLRRLKSRWRKLYCTFDVLGALNCRIDQKLQQTPLSFVLTAQNLTRHKNHTAPTMGIYSLWPLVKSKGYEPTVIRPSACTRHLPGQNSTIHVDLQACLFVAIKKNLLQPPPCHRPRKLEAQAELACSKGKHCRLSGGLRCYKKAQTHAASDKDHTTQEGGTVQEADFLNTKKKKLDQAFTGLWRPRSRL